MAHFAELDEMNKVIRVLVVPNEEEHRGQDFLAVDCNLGGIWIQCSYNANIRKHYPGIGWFYDQQRDAFIAPKPYPSWSLEEETCSWIPPFPRPEDGYYYDFWNEDLQKWEITNPIELERKRNSST
jgi:hypothetical protein